MAKPTPKAGKNEFGKRLRWARERLDLTIADVAREADLSPSMLSRIESGARSDLRLSTASRLCAVLELSLDELVGIGANPKRSLANDLIAMKETIERMRAPQAYRLRVGEPRIRIYKKKT